MTGHTGFKGSWLTLLLHSRGHEISGYSLDPLADGLFSRTALHELMSNDFRGDVRDDRALSRAIQLTEPDYAIHLAAQALVLQGYRSPRETYTTNVNGTLNFLEATAASDSIRSQLVVTSDKVYAPSPQRHRPYLESDALGGDDPYSNSKAMADLLTQEYFKRSYGKPGAIARAGNVIGAGDSAADRLLPDLVRAKLSESTFLMRYPNAIRPWQHVLDCINGYLMLLRAAEQSGGMGPLNFGPRESSAAPVSDVVQLASKYLDIPSSRISSASENKLREQPYLELDSGKARDLLGWEDHFSLAEAVEDACKLLPRESNESRNAILSTISSWSLRHVD